MREALRGFWRSPLVVALAVVTLALGLGVATAVFGVVDVLLIRSLPYPNSERLVEVWWERVPGRITAFLRGAEIVRALREEARLFSTVESFRQAGATITGAGEPESVTAAHISPGLLPLLGVAPRRGRLLYDEDALPGVRVALISERLWLKRFGGGASAVGGRISIEDEPHTIVGVLPGNFGFPSRRVDVWRPLAAEPRRPFRAIAALQPDVPREAAKARLRAVSENLRQADVLRDDSGDLLIMELQQLIQARQHGAAFYLLLAAVALVLLVACGNVANLFLVRAHGRESRFAIMKALGARRSDLLRQSVWEGLFLALLSGCGALLVAEACLAGISRIMPPELTYFSSAAVTVDGRFLGFAVLLSTVTCLAVTVIPSFSVSGTHLVESLKGRTVQQAGAHSRWQSALVVAQLAVVLVLLAGSGLLLRSFVRLVNVDPGFDTEDLLVVNPTLRGDRYRVPGSGLIFFEQLDELVEDSGGVRSATFASSAPPKSDISFKIQPEAEGRQVVDASGLTLPHVDVAPDYFVTMGIPLIAGRTFSSDDPETVVIVNELLARRYWGNDSPIGRRFRLDANEPWHTVIGVARDVKQSGLDDPMGDGMELYFPYSRTKRERSFNFIVRTDGTDAAVVARQVKELLWRLDRSLPIRQVTTMERRLGESVAKPRFFLVLVSIFALLGILLAGVGVYGTTAYWVAQRIRELGLRIALGATRRQIVGLVLGRGLRLAALGAGIGLAGAMATLQVLESFLFATHPSDAETLTGVTVLLVSLVLAACYLPALRASRLDPADVLRSE